MEHTTRLTITIPIYLHNKLKKKLGKRQISKVASKILEENIDKEIEKESQNPWEAFFALRGKFPPMTSAQIKRAIEKGRM